MADLSAPDFETRLAIVHKKMDMEGFFIDDHVAEYIAKTITSNIRELEGAIKKIIAYQDLMKEDITLEIAEKIIIDFNISKSKTITADACIKAVEKHFNLKEGDIISQKKTKDISYPRQVCMYLMRELTKESLPKIGQALGGRDHTTVLYGIKQIEKDIDENSTIKNRTNESTGAGDLTPDSGNPTSAPDSSSASQSQAVTLESIMDDILSESTQESSPSTVGVTQT